MEKKNSYFSYAPETLEEEYAFLAGRVATLEAVMDKDDSNYIEKEDVAAILELSSRVKSKGLAPRVLRIPRRAEYLT